jgi:hypothetical protein
MSLDEPDNIEFFFKVNYEGDQGDTDKLPFELARKHSGVVDAVEDWDDDNGVENPEGRSIDIKLYSQTVMQQVVNLMRLADEAGVPVDHKILPHLDIRQLHPGYTSFTKYYDPILQDDWTKPQDDCPKVTKPVKQKLLQELFQLACALSFLISDLYPVARDMITIILSKAPADMEKNLLK